jgi:LysM repeat protein
VSVAQFNSALADLEKALRGSDRDLALQLTQQMERLAKQTQAALDTLAKSAATRAPTVSTSFTEDYPRQGVTYTVQSGDTLAGIAQRFNSSVRDIQNANKIADPTRLQVGQVLFIPQR